MEYKASHILVKDRSLANMILQKVKGGGNFNALAKEFSICGSKSKGGDLGWFGPGKMVPKFEETVKKLRQGQTSGLVSTQFGFHIIKKTGQRD
jgi:peptidyl-prolyl cis-trans isomerase C